MIHKQNPYNTPLTAEEGSKPKSAPSWRSDLLPNLLFAVPFVAFFANIAHLYDTETNTHWILRWSPLPLGVAGVISFVTAVAMNIRRKRPIMALVVMPFGFLLVAYLWMLIAPSLN